MEYQTRINSVEQNFFKGISRAILDFKGLLVFCRFLSLLPHIFVTRLSLVQML